MIFNTHLIVTWYSYYMDMDITEFRFDTAGYRYIYNKFIYKSI